MKGDFETKFPEATDAKWGFLKGREVAIIRYGSVDLAKTLGNVVGEEQTEILEVKDRNIINQWLMAQMGTVGPMIGQHHQFHHYNPGKSQFGEERFFKITKRIYSELDERLISSKYLAGHKYTIADIATWPWIARHEWHDIGLNDYKNLTRWYLDIASREAVVRGYDLMKNGSKIPMP